MNDKKLFNKRIQKAEQSRGAMIEELQKIAENDGADKAVYGAMEALKELIYWLEIWQCQLQPKEVKHGK